MSAALSLVKGATEREAAGSELGRFAPTEPLSWTFAQGRYADEKGLPLLTRLLARLDNFRLRVWHRHLGNPKLSREGRLVLPLFRGGYNTRAEARALCRAPNDMVFALPHGTLPLDADFRHNPTLCRPLAEPVKDAEHAKLYASADLRAFICPELHERARQLTSALEVQTAKIAAALNEDKHD